LLFFTKMINLSRSLTHSHELRKEERKERKRKKERKSFEGLRT